MIRYSALILLILIVSLSAELSDNPKTSSYSTNKIKDREFPKGEFQPYAENRVHRAGILWLNITNLGYIGNPNVVLLGGYLFTDPCTGKTAKTAEMPGDSDINYLYCAGLMFGGYLDSAEVNVSGTNCTTFQGPLVSTSFDVWGATDAPYVLQNELQPIKFDEDESGLVLGRIYETSNVSGKLNCLCQEVYDPKATAYEQFSVGFTDKLSLRYFTGRDVYDNREHIPLGIEVKQKSFAWPYRFAEKFVIFDYTIYNRNDQRKDIYDFFISLSTDCDVGTGEWQGWDDMCGFIENWNGYIDPATGENKPVEMNLAWTADNDGRDVIGYADNIPLENSGGYPLDGAVGIASVRVLRNPNPNLKYSFNLYSIDLKDESTDWGPRWKKGLHSDWQYDLTSGQKGYDDTNQDSLLNRYDHPLYGGRTEGYPAGDKGKYMVMSNDEFDYSQTFMREIYLGMNTGADGSAVPQAGKWQRWTTENDIGNEDFSDEIKDGSIPVLNDLANGEDFTFMLSFGPLGYESYENAAIDSDRNGVIDGFIPNKKVWKFAYGDSLKLTIAFIVSENFHTSLDQDPNYNDTTVVNLEDGIDASLYDRGWYDAFYNVVWAERVFDTPLFDTPVKKWGATKKDGWFGEDVGADALCGDLVSDTYCWWLGISYPGPDTGEGDFKMTDFTEPVTDIYGNPASNEDLLLRYGRQHESDGYGITGSLANGDGYGYMVKYDKINGIVPQGSWVRYGYDNGKLDAGDGVPDFTAPPPPPSPKIKVTEIDNDIFAEWTSHEFYTGDDGTVGVAGPEFTYDPFTRIYDFEGYNIELSPDRQGQHYTTLFSVDRVNYSYQNVSDVNDYFDNPIPADTLYAHPANYPSTITSFGKIYKLIPYRDNRDLTQDYYKDKLYTYTCTKDSSQFDKWGEIRNYKFILHNQTLAEFKFIAVTAKDFGAAKMGVPSIKSSPESNGTATVTANLTTTNDVVVVPNPYRGDVKYTQIGWENLDGDYTYAEEYRKIAFLNIPERCVIRIYTLAGDLCKVITHNGNSKWDVPYWYGRNGACWNLINDNQQAVMSGIYLFSVQDVDKKKDDFVGKFVIIK